jgi:group II intron reverse transcriptase/maturase
VNKAQRYIGEGKVYVVDLDMERYFDTVNHDKVMSCMFERVKDKRVLKLTRRYLQAGMWRHGKYEERRKGTPQGGPLSPLLANLLLDKLDKELRRRGHKFCRYADDCKIYVGSKLASERVLRSITEFIEKELKLRVNREKSKASEVNQSTFLGYTLSREGELKASQTSISRLKGKIRNKTQAWKGKEIEEVIKELNLLIRGWKAYFKYDQRKGIYEKLDGWIKRRLRSYRLKQRKKYGSIVSWLISLGIERIKAIKLACSGKGWWRLSRTPQLHMAMNNVWFVRNGLISLQK